MTNLSMQTSFAGKSLENSLACPLIWAPPALAWFGALSTLEKAPGSPMVEMTVKAHIQKTEVTKVALN